MIKISSKESRLERYAYLILGLISLMVGFIRIFYGSATYFKEATIPTMKELIFTIFYFFGGFSCCYYWFRTRKKFQ